MNHHGPATTPELGSALSARYGALIWACLDADLVRSAVFYAERYFAQDPAQHDARHLYSTALLRAGQTHSALWFMNTPKSTRCDGCEEVLAEGGARRHRRWPELLAARKNA